jgi:hypothetical protein
MAQLPVETHPSPKIRAMVKNMGALWERVTDPERQSILNTLFKGIYVREKTIEQVEPRKSSKQLFEQ